MTIGFLFIALGAYWFYLDYWGQPLICWLDCYPMSSKQGAGNISDWKTYRNDNFGFEIQYPPHWKEKIRDGDGEIILAFVEPPGEAEILSIIVTPSNPDKLPIEVLMAPLVSLGQKFENLMVDNIPALKDKNGSLLIAKDGNVFYIDNGFGVNASENLFDEVILTLKFIR